MRREFIETESRKKAQSLAPWASRITKVVGGFIAFESIDEFEQWKNQK